MIIFQSEPWTSVLGETPQVNLTHTQGKHLCSGPVSLPFKYSKVGISSWKFSCLITSRNVELTSEACLNSLTTRKFCRLGMILFALEPLPTGYHCIIKPWFLPLTTPWKLGTILGAVRNTAAWGPPPEGLINWSGVQPQHWDFLNLPRWFDTKTKLRTTGSKAQGVTNSNACGDLTGNEVTTVMN